VLRDARNGDDGWSLAGESATLSTDLARDLASPGSVPSTVHAHPQLVTGAEAACLLGVTCRRVLELADTDGFSPVEPTRPAAGGGPAQPSTRGLPPILIPARSSPALSSHPTATIPCRSGRCSTASTSCWRGRGAVPEPPERFEPADALDLAPNPLGHDPHRRRPWGSD